MDAYKQYYGKSQLVLDCLTYSYNIMICTALVVYSDVPNPNRETKYFWMKYIFKARKVCPGRIQVPNSARCHFSMLFRITFNSPSFYSTQIIVHPNPITFFFSWQIKFFSASISINIFVYFSGVILSLASSEEPAKGKTEDGFIRYNSECHPALRAWGIRAGIYLEIQSIV